MKKQDLTLSFVGDVMIARGIQDTIVKNGPEYLFAKTGDILRDSQIVFGNLESPVSHRGQPLQFKNVCLRADPAVAKALKYGNFNVMSIANNHIFDYGPDALLDTVTNIQGLSIKTVGAGANRKQAEEPVIVKANDLRIGFIAATRRCEATIQDADKPQAAQIDYEAIKSSIKLLGEKADIVVVSLHTGVEYCECPSPEDYSSCLALLDAGADVIIGTHPHVLQGILFRNGKLVAFSLGNFVFDNIEEAKGDEKVWESGILKVFISDGSVAGYDFIPVHIDASGQPRIVNGEEKKLALAEMDRLSAMLNDEYIQKNFWKMAGTRTVSDTIPVLARKFREHGLSFFLEMLPRIRPRHLRFLFEWMRSKLRSQR